MFFQERPVEPTDFVILAIGVVISLLGTPYFIAHRDHGHSDGEQRGRKEILHLATAHLFDFRIVRGAFDAAIPGTIVVGAVAVLLEVGFIVLLFIGDQIVQREAVVTGDEVDALLGFALLVTIKVRTADVAIGKRTDGFFFGAEEVAPLLRRGNRGDGIEREGEAWPGQASKHQLAALAGGVKQKLCAA